MMKTNQLEGFQIKGLKLLKQIDRGSFGVVYQAVSLKNSKQYAVKIEQNTTKNPQLNFQFDVYNQFFSFLVLSNLENNYFANIYALFSNNQYTFMVMEKLGKNLYKISKEKNQMTDKKKVLNYALKMLKIIHFLHATNFVYRDIKPQNFVSKLNEPQQLVLVDFGLCKKEALKKQKLKLKNKGTLIGTSRYASINSHQGKQVNKSDDIESLSYLIIYLLKGSLPWQGLKIKRETQKNSQVLKIKRNITVEQLCEGLPKGIHNFFQYVKSLPKRQTVDYNFIIMCFEDSKKQYQEKQKNVEDNSNVHRTQQQCFPFEKKEKKQTIIKNEHFPDKSSQGSKNQSRSLKRIKKKSTKKPLIKRVFLIKEDVNDEIQKSLSSQNQDQSSKFAIN